MDKILNLDLGKTSDAIIPDTIFGMNLELYQHAVTSLLNDRLQNPKFFGEPNRMTGLPDEWSTPSSNFSGVHYDLTAGEGIMGSNALTIECTTERPAGVIQPNRLVRAGETLEVSFWGRCIHQPCKIETGIRSPSLWGPPYTATEVVIDSACWKEYTCTFDLNCDDDNAVFFFILKERGIVCLDQIHMRPVGTSDLNDELLKELGDFRIPVLRFPGGCLTTCYHWKYGTGERYLRPVLPDPVFKNSMNYDFGTDEYLDFCYEYSIIPQISVNIGTDAPGETAAWAVYCSNWFKSRKITPPKIYWQLGNEHYGAWERSHMSPKMYAAAINEIAPQIKESYPHSVIVVLGQRQGQQYFSYEKDPWRETVVKHCRENVDFIVAQHYATVPKADDPVRQHQDVFENFRWMVSELKDLTSTAKAVGLRAGMSEWNLWTKASHFDPEGFVEPLDMQHCLYVASMFNLMARLAPDFELANYYNLIEGMGIFAMEKDQIKRRALADIFVLYRECFPAKLIDCKGVGFNPESGEIDDLDVLAVEKDGRRHLFIINRSLTDKKQLSLPESFVGGAIFIFSADGPLDEVLTRKEESDIDGELTIQPLSIVRIVEPVSGFKK